MSDGQVDVRVSPALVDRHHPLASVEGAFNAVMLQGDAIREIMLEGPGAGGIETASAVVADMVSVIGTTGTGFLQNDACWRELERMPAGALASPFYLQIEVADRPGVLAHVAERLAAHEVSVARLVQHQADEGATLHVVTHEAPAGSVADALAEIEALPESRARPTALPVIAAMTVPLAERYRDRLPIIDATPIVSLGEGSTPLLPRPGSARGSASTCASSGRPRTRPGATRIAA